MSFKLLVLTLTLSVASVAQAFCPNSFRVANDASRLERSSSYLAVSANRAWAYNLERIARNVSQASMRLGNMARSNFDCVQLRSQYNRVANLFQNLQRVYRQGHNSYNTYLNRDFREAAFDFRALTQTVRTLQRAPRNPRRPLPPRGPRGPRHPRR